MGYIIAYWLGVMSCWLVVYLGTHPDKRSAILGKLKGLVD